MHWQTLLTSYSLLLQIGEQFRIVKLNWVFVGQIKHVVLLITLLVIWEQFTLEIQVDWQSPTQFKNFELNYKYDILTASEFPWINPLLPKKP